MKNLNFNKEQPSKTIKNALLTKLRPGLNYRAQKHEFKIQNLLNTVTIDFH